MPFFFIPIPLDYLVFTYVPTYLLVPVCIQCEFGIVLMGDS